MHLTSRKLKPKINIDDPKIKFINEYLINQSILALDAPQKVEGAVVPIYALPKSKAHERQKHKAQQIGSGVMVQIKNEYFMFTATHVAFEFNEYQLLTGSGNGSRIEAHPVDRFSTGNAASPNLNPLDASVFHFQQKPSEELQKIAISILDFDFEESNTNDSVFLATGFRVRESNVVGQNVFSKREAFPSIEFRPDGYKLLEKSAISQFVMAFDDQVLKENKWTTSPLVKGFSGGAIIQAKGTNINFNKKNTSSPVARQLLTAIIIEHHREKHKLPGYVLATRVNVFFGLINKFLPGFLDDVIQAH